MKITCKTLKHTEYSVTLDEVDATISDLLDRLATEYEELERDKLRLIWSGKILEEAEKLSELGYQDENWMVLMLRKKRKTTEAPKEPEPVTSVPVPEPFHAGEAATLSEEQVEELLSILNSDPACATLFQSMPVLAERIREPRILIELLRRMGKTPEDLLAANRGSTPARANQAQVVRLTRAEIGILQGVKDRFLEVIGGVAACPLTDGQLNSIVYQAYQGSDKNAEEALSLLLSQFLA